MWRAPWFEDVQHSYWDGYEWRPAKNPDGSLKTPELGDP